MLAASAARTGELAWVGELSDATTGQAETLEIWTPAGEYTTVGIYNTVTVKLHVTEAVPRADMGFGFCADSFRFSYPDSRKGALAWP